MGRDNSSILCSTYFLSVAGRTLLILLLSCHSSIMIFDVTYLISLNKMFQNFIDLSINNCLWCKYDTLLRELHILQYVLT